MVWNGHEVYPNVREKEIECNGKCKNVVKSRRSPRFLKTALIASVQTIGQVQEDKDKRKRR